MVWPHWPGRWCAMVQTRLHWPPYWVLALTVFTVSWRAILIRIAAAPALVTGAVRLALASLILTLFALWGDVLAGIYVCSRAQVVGVAG